MNQSKKYLAYIAWNIFSGAATIIGLAGLPDNIRSWGSVFETLNSVAARWTLGLVGIMALVWVNVRWFLGRLQISYDPNANFVIGTPANGAQARVVVHNPKRVPVKNLTVKILSLVPMHSKERLRRKSAQFPGMPLRIVRGQQGMELAGHGFVEVWVVQHAKGDDKLVFLTSEAPGAYHVDVGEYLLTIAAAADGIDGTKQSFFVKATKQGTLTFEKR